MYAETPSRLILVGELGDSETASLIDYCRRLHVAGQTKLVIDMNGVTDCDRAAVDGLIALVAGNEHLVVTVRGARWNQFMTVLTEAPIVEVPRLVDSARLLMGTAAPLEESASTHRKEP